ncbi:MAG: ABC transporter ATP-binding protein [Actinomycetota bacterium]|nr:ABC transporter ATP-binding protein [Actinomycetota bacterium]
MSLAADFVVQRGSLRLSVNLAVAPGEVLVLLGPNGAGKSTVLRVLAGLLPPDAGRVSLGESVLDDSAAGRHVPPYDRPVGVVFQDYLLFPHLSTMDNVAFGLRSRKVPKAQARTVAYEWLERVGLVEYARVKPGSLSGGQSQRVALARALVGSPELLLLDEPLAALDARTKLEVRADLRRHLAQYAGAAVVVSHDPIDAMALADEVAVIERGRVVQSGPPAEVARRPRTDYVARLIGLTLLAGTGEGSQVRLESGVAVSVAEPAQGSVYVAIRPESVAVYPTRPHGSPRNVWPARVASATPHGSAVRCDLTGPVPLSADLTATAFAELGLAPGSEIWASVKAHEVDVYAR